MTSALKAFWVEEDGQDLVEYSLLMAFIALAAVAVLGNVGTTIKGLFTNINTSLTAANTNAAAINSGS